MKLQFWLCAILAIVVVELTTPTSVWSMGSSDKNKTADAKEAEYYKAGEAAIKAWKWMEAIGWMKKTTGRNPKNANAYNYLGYAYRNLKKYDAALMNYKEALKIQPEHKGAHEYIGEAYLQLKKLSKAEEHLAALDKICFFGCEEYDELKAAVAAYKKKHNKSS